MDKEHIGKFIKECLDNKNISDKELSSKIKVSIKTINKWKTGKKLPEVSIMPSLCTELNISINELISGKKIEEENYIKEAEKNLLNLKKQEEINNTILCRLKIITQVICLILFIILTIISLIDKTENIFNVVLFTIGFISLIVGIYVTIIIDKEIKQQKD